MWSGARRVRRPFAPGFIQVKAAGAFPATLTDFAPPARTPPEDDRWVPRDGFTSSFGVIAATLGSAVGLGNIWKFPYLTGANGGAGFLLVYVLATLAVGLPVMISEIAIGRAARADAVTAFVELAPPRQPWWLIGAMGVVAAVRIMAFYSAVAGWVFAYVLKSLVGGALSTDPQVTSAALGALVADPLQALLWQWLVLVSSARSS
jgi:NSS family neurotransmitter:Na+ symporter